MRIKKVEQSVGLMAQVVNSDSEGITNTYSCNYINDHKGDTLPIGTIIDYNGSNIPDGYELYTDTSTMVQKTLFETTTWADMMTRYQTKAIDFTPYSYVEVEFTGQGGTNATNTILKIDLTQPFKTVITNDSVSYSYGASVCYPDIQLLQGVNTDPGIFRIGACISTAKDKIWMGDPGYFTGQTSSGNFDSASTYNRIAKIVGFKPLQRLRKIAQPIRIGDRVIYDSYNTSTSDTYSCNYINDLCVYSANEKRIGVWIDGKSIYRKIISSSIVQGEGTYPHVPTGISNLDKIIKLENTVYYGNGRYNSHGRLTCYLDKNQNNDIVFISPDVTGDIIIILEYTKTTD